MRIVIVGAGRGGSALLELFNTCENIEVVGIADRNKNAPGLALARELKVRVFDDLKGLCECRPDIIINVTGVLSVSAQIREHAGCRNVEVVEGNSARLLLGIETSQKKSRNDFSVLYQTGIQLTRSKDLQQVLEAVLDSAMHLTETPAGSIALMEAGVMVMKAAKGLSSTFSEASSWTPRKYGLSSFVLSQRELVAFNNIDIDPLFKDTIIPGEGIKSLLASPLWINGDVIGILYLNDFKPREFTDRHKWLIKLFSVQAAHAIDKFKLLARLEESLANLQTVFNDSQDMIIVADIDGRILRFSRGGERILGYAQPEVIGMNAGDFYVDRDVRAHIMRELREKGVVLNHEAALRKKDGTIVEISLTVSQLKDKRGAVIGTIGISKDITLEKRLKGELEELNRNLEDKVIERTRELERANRDLKNANELKGRFIANASHELRTPLHAITGFSEIMLEKSFGELNERQTKFMNTVLTSGKHLLHLVNNILDLAKIEAGKANLSYSKFGLRETIEEVAMVVKPLAERKLIQLENTCADDVGDFVADKVKFKQVLYNLLSNAIKFTPENGRVGITVERFVNNGALLWAPKGQELLKLCTWDTGPGIKPEDRERIFEEFEQLDPSKHTEGTGLGLSLTKKLIEIHGGQIEVEDNEGGGAHFSVYLPFVTTEEPELPEGVKPSLFPFPAIAENGALVLVVEDDLPTVELLTIYLLKAGYRVAHAFDGVEAIEKAKALKPFVITLDVMLPKKDGWEVLQTLKADPETKDIPVIIHSVIDNTELAFTLGATDYLIKPLEQNALMDKLRNIANESKKKRCPVSVLIMTGDAQVKESVANMLEADGIIIHHAVEAVGGVDLAMATRPNAIIVDVESLKNGFDVVSSIKLNPSLEDTPIFVLTSHEFTADERRLLSHSVANIFKKDTLKTGEFLSHLKNLEMLYPEKAGLFDDVTMLFNRRYLKIRLSQEISRSARYNLPLVLLMIDVDRFDNYLSRKGEYYGNLMLKKITELLRRSTRSSDVVARYDRNSFCLILTNTFIDAGAALAKRFISMVHDYPFLYEEVQPNGRVTVSIGAVTFKKGNTVDGIVGYAETALAEARKKGGNRLEVYAYTNL